MFKAWINLWKNTFNFTGVTTRKEYWSAIIMNIIAMYILVIPYSLIFRAMGVSWSFFKFVFVIYIVAFVLPIIALYFRRARDANWKITTALLMVVLIPCLNFLIVGMFPYRKSYGGYGIIGKLLAFSFALFFYGGMLGIILYNDPSAFPWLPIAGLLLASGVLLAHKTLIILLQKRQ